MIETKGLSVRFGAKPVLCDVSMTLPANQVTAIVGPSGCGKSTLLAALNRMTDLLPNASVAGDIFIHGQDIRAATLDVADLRRRVGMVFQRPNPFPLSIERNVQLGVREHGLAKRSELGELTEQALRAVGLWAEVKDRLRQSALQLSGGQQQRLCLARTLALRPDVVLMDEPCSALDPLATQRIETLMDELSGEYTIVLVTHDLAQARRVADHLVVFGHVDHCGRVLATGPADALFEGPAEPRAAAYLQGRWAD